MKYALVLTALWIAPLANARGLVCSDLTNPGYSATIELDNPEPLNFTLTLDSLPLRGYCGLEWTMDGEEFVCEAMDSNATYRLGVDVGWRQARLYKFVDGTADGLLTAMNCERN
jgi:hypothetical protein